MPVCIVPSCLPRGKGEAASKRLFRLPIRDKEKLKVWLGNVGLNAHYQSLGHHRLCSDHFERESFMDPTNPQTSRLRHDAVPVRRRAPFINVIYLPEPFRRRDDKASAIAMPDVVQSGDGIVKVEQVHNIKIEDLAPLSTESRIVKLSVPLSMPAVAWPWPYVQVFDTHFLKSLCFMQYRLMNP